MPVNRAERSALVQPPFLGHISMTGRELRKTQARDMTEKQPQQANADSAEVSSGPETGNAETGNAEKGNDDGTQTASPASGQPHKDSDVSIKAEDAPVERGGPRGPEPTRFGDWEQKGRCSDF